MHRNTVYDDPAEAAAALDSRCGGGGPLWHVGHSGNPHNRLGLRRVRPEYPLVCVECIDGFVADAAERILVDRLGYDGRAGGGKETSIYVYAVPLEGLYSLDRR